MTQRTLSQTLTRTTRTALALPTDPAPLVKLNAEVLPGNPKQHLVFLHGLFG